MALNVGTREQGHWCCDEADQKYKEGAQSIQGQRKWKRRPPRQVDRKVFSAPKDNARDGQSCNEAAKQQGRRYHPSPWPSPNDCHHGRNHQQQQHQHIKCLDHEEAVRSVLPLCICRICFNQSPHFSTAGLNCSSRSLMSIRWLLNTCLAASKTRKIAWSWIE